MKDFNSYLDNLDYSLVKDLFHEKGKQRIYHKKDFFIRQNEISRFAEWVENGTFQYTYIDGEGWKIQCKLPPKTKRFCPLKTFNNAPLKSLDRWGYYYFRFLSVRLNRLKNKLLANYLRNRGNDLATVRNSAFCVAILSNNSFICKYNIFFRKYELSVAIL